MTPLEDWRWDLGDDRDQTHYCGVSDLLMDDDTADRKERWDRKARGKVGFNADLPRKRKGKRGRRGRNE